MINISIESFKLLLNEINQIENIFIIIIIRDALLSIGASNEETSNQDHHLTSVLVNNQNISLLRWPTSAKQITILKAK